MDKTEYSNTVIYLSSGIMVFVVTLSGALSLYFRVYKTIYHFFGFKIYASDFYLGIMILIFIIIGFPLAIKAIRLLYKNKNKS